MAHSGKIISVYPKILNKAFNGKYRNFKCKIYPRNIPRNGNKLHHY